MFAILRGVGAATSSLLHPHFSSKQLFPVYLRHRFLYVLRLLERDEGVTLSAAKAFWQADVRTIA